MKNMPPAAATTPPVNIRDLKMSKVSSGSASFPWRRTNNTAPTTHSTTATTNRDQPEFGFTNSLIAMVRPDSANSAYTEEIRSQCFAGFGMFSGASQNVRARAMSTIGTLIRKTEPHQNASSSAPPTSGPSAAPTTATDPQIPIAVLRSRSSGNVRRISASVAGIITAAPMPSSPRAPTSSHADGANAAANDATPNTTSPTMNIRRWPSLSPSVPVPSSSPASTSG